MFYRINRINIYQASETLGTLFIYPSQLCLTFSGCWFSWCSKMWFWTVWTLVPSQSVTNLHTCPPYLNNVARKTWLVLRYWLLPEPLMSVSTWPPGPSFNPPLPSYVSPVGFSHGFFSGCSAILYCTQHSIHSLASFLFFFPPDLLLYILNGKYVLPFILVVLSFRQYDIFHFFSFVCVSHGKLWREIRSRITYFVILPHL